MMSNYLDMSIMPQFLRISLWVAMETMPAIVNDSNVFIFKVIIILFCMKMVPLNINYCTRCAR